MLKPVVVFAIDVALQLFNLWLRLFLLLAMPVYNFVMKTLGADKLLAYVITHHRWVFALFFLMPASLVTELLFYARNRYILWSSAAVAKHEEAVADVKRQVMEWRRKKDDGKIDTKMCTARPGWLATSLRVPKVREFCGLVGYPSSFVVFHGHLDDDVFFMTLA